MVSFVFAVEDAAGGFVAEESFEGVFEVEEFFEGWAAFVVAELEGLGLELCWRGFDVVLGGAGGDGGSGDGGEVVLVVLGGEGAGHVLVSVHEIHAATSAMTMNGDAMVSPRAHSQQMAR